MRIFVAHTNVQESCTGLLSRVLAAREGDLHNALHEWQTALSFWVKLLALQFSHIDIKSIKSLTRDLHHSADLHHSDLDQEQAASSSDVQKTISISPTIDFDFVNRNEVVQ